MQATDLPTNLQELVEPCVIDQDLLVRLVIEQGPKGEAGRLLQEDGIKLDEIEEIRIEFLDVLRIDHLWPLKNLVRLKLSNNVIEKIENLDSLVHLKELDLSFNSIEKIENLDRLVGLETLLLHDNVISRLENLETLENLTIFSVRKNLIDDREHVLYLRKFKTLRSLTSLENPCCEEEGYVDYLIAFIPQLIYYEYAMITEAQRQAALDQHYRALSSLEDVEAHERRELEAKKEYEEKLETLTVAYVEYLDGTYLFDSMFDGDKEGNELLKVNEDTQSAFEEYKKNFSLVCQEMCEFGLKEHDRRTTEIKLFDEAVQRGKRNAQDQGRAIVDKAIQRKLEIIGECKESLRKLTEEVDTATVQDVIERAQKSMEEFTIMIEDAWSKLMANEAELHEQLEDVNEVFCINIRDLVDTFLETMQGYFSQLRNCEAEYNDTINSLVLYYLSGFGDDSKIPSHLVNVCGDKEILGNNLAASHDAHLQVIDAREDLMLGRMKKWLENYTESLTKREFERNRSQILEISHFVDFQKEEFDTLRLTQGLNLDTTDPDILLALEG